MNKKAYIISSLFLFFLAALIAFPQETILIKNGTIVPVYGKTIKNGDLLIQNGKILKIGTDIKAPSDAMIIDSSGKYVYPGIIALMTAVGVAGYPGAGNDQNEVGLVTPQMDPYDAINPEDNTIEVTRMGGVTTVHTTSGSRNIINGKSVILNLEGTLAHEMVIKKYAAQIFNIGIRGENKYPTTLSGTITLIREKLDKALKYTEKKNEKNSKENFNKRDLEMEALVPVVTRKVRAVFLTNDEVTLRNAISIIKDYNLNGVIQAGKGIYKYAEKLAEEKIPVIWSGTTAGPGRWESFDKYFRAAGMLAKKGIMFAFATGGFGGSSYNIRNLPLPAAISVAHGLAEEEALKALTIYPAIILGIDDMVGSLEAGKMANVVIWTGSPLQMTSRIYKVIINGKLIPEISVQTQLRDKFDKIVRNRMKKKK